jgi:hypothetical protein
VITIQLTQDQLEEVIMACEFPDWENDDFKSAVIILHEALAVHKSRGVQHGND